MIFLKVIETAVVIPCTTTMDQTLVRLTSFPTIEWNVRDAVNDCMFSSAPIYVFWASETT